MRDLSRPDSANDMGLLGCRPATPSTVDPKTPAMAVRAARPGPLIVRVSRGVAIKNSRRFKQNPAFVIRSDDVRASSRKPLGRTAHGKHSNPPRPGIAAGGRPAIVSDSGRSRSAQARRFSCLLILISGAATLAGASPANRSASSAAPSIGMSPRSSPEAALAASKRPQRWSRCPRITRPSNFRSPARSPASSSPSSPSFSNSRSARSEIESSLSAVSSRIPT